MGTKDALMCNLSSDHSTVFSATTQLGIVALKIVRSTKNLAPCRPPLVPMDSATNAFENAKLACS